MIETIDVDPRIKVRDLNDLLLIPQVLHVRAITEQATRTFAREMSLAHQTGQTIVPLVINSYGGDCYALMTLIDIIKTSKLPIATIVEGKAMSCGAILFTCGTEGHRYIAPGATLMIHDVSSIEPRKKALEIEVDAKETRRLNRKLYRIMEKNIGQPTNYLWDQAEEMNHVDWYMSPKEAISHNIANHVGIPSFRTVVKVEMGLEL